MPRGRTFASEDSAPRQRRKMTESERKKRESKKVKTSQKSKEFLFKCDLPISTTRSVVSSNVETENEATNQSTISNEHEDHDVISNNFIELDGCAEEAEADGGEESNSMDNIEAVHLHEEGSIYKYHAKILKARVQEEVTSKLNVLEEKWDVDCSKSNE